MIANRPQLQAGLLTIVAGLADAVGYVAMGGLFAANMTGNTVLAGLSPGEGHFDLAAKKLAPLVTFFLGAMLARLLLRLFHRPAVPLLIEAGLLAGVGFRPIDHESALLALTWIGYLSARDNRNPKRCATDIGPAYSDASRTRCTVL